MITSHLQPIRKILVFSSPLAVLAALLHLIRSTATPVVTATTQGAIDPNPNGRATAWLIFAGVFAVSTSWPLVTEWFGRKHGRHRAPEQSASQPPATSDPPLPLFPNYLQLRTKSRLSLRFWSKARWGMVIAAFVYIALLIVRPEFGLWLWWQVTVPVLPLIFLVVPGVWRNVCPLAASNQLPRVLNFTRALNPPKWLKEYGFVIGVVAFFALASSRKWLFNHDGPATGLLILVALASAMLGGYFFKGKSGWCSSICPLYPVQRLYNRTPFATVPNAHCAPCVGCTKNCYDFNPGSAYLADMHDDEPHYASCRKFFAAVMPGFIVAYFTLPDPVDVSSVFIMYLQFALYMVLSIGVFSVLETFLKVSASRLTAIYGAVALNLFYGLGLPNWLKAVGRPFGLVPLDGLPWALRASILIVTVIWLVRTYRQEQRFLDQRREAEELRLNVTPAARSDITFMPTELHVPVEAGRTLLEIAESHQQPIKSGCRMGVCGADPILIVDGMEHLPPMSADEKSTLERLNLGPNCRLACMCRPNGAVTVSLDLQAAVNPIGPAKPIEPAKPPASPRAIEPMYVPSHANPNEPSMITFMPTEVRVPADPNCTLLEIAECNQQPLEAGCRMGVCGADPVLIMDGMENLTPLTPEEKSTLDRLGLGVNCRLACMCRPRGSLTVSLDTKAAVAKVAVPVVTDFDRNLKSVVIIGNGAAGITAADTVRRHHPECEIHLISREKHAFYNRMAITRLIYGRSAMSGLYMQSDAWYDERKITCWLNTHATHINRGHKQVELATGETLNYDKLILASGSSSFVPPISGYGLPGSFVLREAEEAMEIRAYVQKNKSKTAVIAGGGLLGLETAYALHKMGLTVWVLERGEWLLRRQLDESGGRALKQYLEALGLVIETSAETACVGGETQVTHVDLKDGRTLPCDVFLVAVGIQPNTELARAAGLRVNRGVLVDEKMRTSAPDIFAAGDVCEFSGQVPGLWAVAVEQAKVAALNAVGVPATYDEVVPVTMLKVAGVDVTSMGRIETRSDAEIEIAHAHVEGNGYRKLVIADGKLVGATLVGDPSNAQSVAAAVKERREVSHLLDALHAGHWDVLRDPDAKPDVHAASKWTVVTAPQPKPIIQALPAAERVIRGLVAQSAMIERASVPQEELVASFE